MEVITNPQLEVANLKSLSTIAGKHGIPLVADTTAIPFNVFSASESGVNIEIISSTKYISGGATSLGGLILDYGTVDYSRSPKLGELSATAGSKSFTFKLKKRF